MKLLKEVTKLTYKEYIEKLKIEVKDICDKYEIPCTIKLGENNIENYD